MKIDRLTGPGAGVRKYDLLTAIAVAGLAGSPREQTTVLRLIAIVTARYNWLKDEIAMGQREMAAIWSVDERTAKREVKRLLESGLLLNLRPGVRGRVAVYRLNISEIQELGATHAHRVGVDFAARMTRTNQVEPSAIIRVDFSGAGIGTEHFGPVGWQRAFARLAHSEPELAAAWFSQLAVTEEEGTMTLAAPSSFHADYIRTHFMEKIHRAIRHEMTPVPRIEVICTKTHRLA